MYIIDFGKITEDNFTDKQTFEMSHTSDCLYRNFQDAFEAIKLLSIEPMNLNMYLPLTWENNNKQGFRIRQLKVLG